MNDLITVKRQKLLTTSLVVAEKFKKQHKDVIKKIENLVRDDEEDRLYFAPIFHQDFYGRDQKAYVMDRRSFSILCMGFTGKKALKWKNDFYDAFESMETILLQQKNESWQQARLEGKSDRLEFTDSIKNLVEFAESCNSKNAKTYYTTITKMVYGLLFNIKKVPKNFRDSLDKPTLRQLQLIEMKASEWLDEAVSRCDDYHEPYKELKARIQSLVDVIGNIDLGSRKALGS